MSNTIYPCYNHLLKANGEIVTKLILETGYVERPVITNDTFSGRFWFECHQDPENQHYIIRQCWVDEDNEIVKRELGFTQEMSISSVQEFLHGKSGIHFEYDEVPNG